VTIVAGGRAYGEESVAVRPEDAAKDPVTIQELLFGSPERPSDHLPLGSERGPSRSAEQPVSVFELLYGTPHTTPEVSSSFVGPPASSPSSVVPVVDRPDADLRLRPLTRVVPAPSEPYALPPLTAPAGAFVFWTWVRNIGLVIFLFVAWQIWGTSISQHHAQHQLHTAFDAALHSHRPPATAASSGQTLIPAEQVVPPAAEGSVVAHLQIPAIGVDQYVVSGTSENDLSEGPGHYIGTAAPGQAGNVAIAGHRTTHGAPFNRLGGLTVGDDIIMTTTWGEKLTYVVSQPPQAVSPSDVAVLNYFGDNRVTLTTCNPEFSATQRLVVVGELKQPVATTPTKVHPVAYHVVNPVTPGWDWPLLPLVGIEAGLLMLLGLSNRQFTAWFGRSTRWLLLVPLWAVGFYVLFQTLTSFLPATL
jgi:sortase A